MEMGKIRAAHDAAHPSKVQIDFDWVAAQIKAGHSVAAVADRLGCAASTLYARARKEGIRLGGFGVCLDLNALLYEIRAGKTVAAAAAVQGYSEASAHRVAKQNGVRLQDFRPAPAPRPPAAPPAPRVDLQKAQALLNDGWSVEGIAAEHKISASAIYRKIRTGELTRPPRKRPIAAAVATPPAGSPSLARAQPTAIVPKMAQPRRARPGLRVPQMPRDPQPAMPQGYVSELLATNGKYHALESWRAKFAPILGREIGPAKALQEWHKYRGHA